MKNKYELADLLLHNPKFNPEKLINFKDLLRSKIVEQIEKALEQVPELTESESAIIADSNYHERGSYEPACGHIIILGPEVSDDEAIALLEAAGDHINDEFGNEPAEYVENETAPTPSEDTPTPGKKKKLGHENPFVDDERGVFGACISYLKTHPNTRTFEVQTPGG